MKKYILLLIITVAAGFGFIQNSPAQRWWYPRPAQNRNEALPVGNGQTSALIFGGTGEERLLLNENTLPCGDLFLTVHSAGEITEYRRELNLSEAVQKTAYKQNGLLIEQEIFASAPDNLIVIRLSGSKPKSLNCSLRLSPLHPASQTGKRNGVLTMEGSAPGNSAGKEIRFSAQLKPVASGRARISVTDSGIQVRNTDEAYFLLALATEDSESGRNPSLKASEIIKKASAFRYDALKKRHADQYKPLFDSVSLSLESDPKQEELPTGIRLEKMKERDDPGLDNLLFQYSRYLKISHSKPDGETPIGDPVQYASEVSAKLLQTAAGYLCLLPALPDSWKNGSVKGLKAPGNFELEISWKDRRLSRAVIRSEAGGRCLLLTDIPVKIEGAMVVASRQGKHFAHQFKTEKNRRYIVTSANKEQ